MGDKSLVGRTYTYRPTHRAKPHEPTVVNDLSRIGRAGLAVSLAYARWTNPGRFCSISTSFDAIARYKRGGRVLVDGEPPSDRPTSDVNLALLGLLFLDETLD